MRYLWEMKQDVRSHLQLQELLDSHSSEYQANNTNEKLALLPVAAGHKHQSSPWWQPRATGCSSTSPWRWDQPRETARGSRPRSVRRSRRYEGRSGRRRRERGRWRRLIADAPQHRGVRSLELGQGLVSRTRLGKRQQCFKCFGHSTNTRLSIYVIKISWKLCKLFEHSLSDATWYEYTYRPSQLTFVALIGLKQRGSRY